MYSASSEIQAHNIIQAHNNYDVIVDDPEQLLYVNVGPLP